MKVFGILNGPNLDRLGEREPDVYGKLSLQAIRQQLDELADSLNAKLLHFQSNHEGELVDKIWEFSDKQLEGIVLNPAAFSHTSVAIRDALKGAGIPTVEVHISNVYARESFRSQLVTAGSASAVMSGFGAQGYSWALEWLVRQACLKESEN